MNAADRTLSTHSFTIHLVGVNLDDDSLLDALYEAGCSDAAFSSVDGEVRAAFDRRAASFEQALVTAIRDLEVGAPESRVVRVAPDGLITLSEIATAVGQTRESVRLYSKGARGPGGFPAPAARAGARSQLWWWPEVAAWFRGIGAGEFDLAAAANGAGPLVAALNSAYALRDRSAGITSPEQRALLEEVVRSVGFSDSARLRGGS